MNLDMLKEVGDILDGQVKKGDVVGGAVAVFKDGEQIYRRNSGFADRERGIPVRDDTIYRIYSMTKPITAAAVMILYDRGLFRLEDKLSDYIPEFAHPTVLPRRRLCRHTDHSRQYKRRHHQHDGWTCHL